MSRDTRKPAFCICKNKDADQLSVTAHMISVFDFARTHMTQFLFFLTFKPLVFRDCTARLVSDLVGNPAVKVH